MGSKMKNLKLQNVAYVLTFISLVGSYLAVNFNKELFGINSGVQVELNQELLTAVNRLEIVCGKTHYSSAEDEFVYGQVCNQGKSLRREVEHLRNEVEISENETCGQFWLSVLVLSFVVGGALMIGLMAMLWIIKEQAYRPITVKVPRTELGLNGS